MLCLALLARELRAKALEFLEKLFDELTAKCGTIK
jgi:hypothetical protein